MLAFDRSRCLWWRRLLSAIHSLEKKLTTEVKSISMGLDASFPRIVGAQFVAANINALLRRFAPADPPLVMTFGRLTVDANQREFFVAGQAAQLSTFEFQLIWYLAQHSGWVVAHDEIYRELSRSAYNGYDRSIDVYVSRIRQKIGDDTTSLQIPEDCPRYRVPVCLR